MVRVLKWVVKLGLGFQTGVGVLLKVFKLGFGFQNISN